MTIPNRIPLILLVSFIVVAPFTGMEWQTFAMSIAAAAAVFFACFALFAANVMGGGDAKLLTAAAVWYGFNASLIEFLLAVTFIGGVLTLGILLLRSRSQEIMAAGIPIPDSLLVAKKIPYGIGIAIAGLLTYGETPIVKAAIASLS
ncbi:UNVERIFIED_ORG: prepilin peptidase CpaA [Rhizobium nepotum]|nr:prepilin peptidase CpaA [Rhizobium nepotum]